MYCILLVVCFIIYSSSASTGTTLNSGTCVNPTTLSFIENSLSNISDQLKGSSNGVSDSLTSVTSLLQLSMLKEMIGSYKEKSPNNNNEEGLALLKRIELKLNSSTEDISNRLNVLEQDIPSAISSLQSQVSSLSSDVKKICQLLSRHVNITVDDEEEAPSSPLLSSCEAILSKWPNSPSGYYSLVDVNGHTRHVYCHMETLCGKGGGWRRIASLNMTDPNEKCPTQFKTYSQGGVRACGRPATSSGSCVGITFSGKEIRYSQVCGRVIGYQVGITDAAYRNEAVNINGNYADGVSLTHGNPRKHIWTLMSGATDVQSYNLCPCSSIRPVSPPSFVGSHYYCEAGCHSLTCVTGRFYPNDRSWDGEDCDSIESTCCQRDLIPWFYRSLGYSTTNYIEMRICCDEGTNDEDVPIEQYEIYVK